MGTGVSQGLQLALFFFSHLPYHKPLGSPRLELSDGRESGGQMSWEDFYEIPAALLEPQNVVAQFKE